MARQDMAWHGTACNSKRSRAQNVRPIQNSQIYFCQLFNAFHYVFTPCVLCLLNTHRRTHTCTHRQSLNGPMGAKELLYSCCSVLGVCILFSLVSLCAYILSHLYFWFHFPQNAFSIDSRAHTHALFLCSLFIKRLTLIGYRKSTIHVCYDRFFWQILFFVFVVFDHFYLSLSLCFSSTTLNSLFLCHSLTSSLHFLFLYHQRIWWVFAETRQTLLLLHTEKNDKGWFEVIEKSFYIVAFIMRRMQWKKMNETIKMWALKHTHTPSTTRFMCIY